MILQTICLNRSTHTVLVGSGIVHLSGGASPYFWRIMVKVINDMYAARPLTLYSGSAESLPPAGPYIGVVVIHNANTCSTRHRHFDNPGLAQYMQGVELGPILVDFDHAPGMRGNKIAEVVGINNSRTSQSDPARQSTECRAIKPRSACCAER